MTSPERKSPFAQAASEQYASLSAEEKAAQVNRLGAARTLAIARKRASGQWKDPLTPEQRRELGRSGGLASAAKRIARSGDGSAIMGEAARQQCAAARSVYSARRSALRLPEEQVLALAPPDRELVRGRRVRLPRSSGRNTPETFVKLLCRVEPDRYDAFGFVGKLLPRGGTVLERDLWPTSDYPPYPVLLECAGAADSADVTEAEGPTEAEYVYVLWRMHERKFVEIARMQSMSWEWSVLLRPLAVHALAQQGFPRQRKSVDLAAWSRGTTALLDARIALLDADDQNSGTCILHDSFAARLSAGAARTIPAIVEVIDEVVDEGDRPEHV